MAPKYPGLPSVTAWRVAGRAWLPTCRVYPASTVGNARLSSPGDLAGEMAKPPGKAAGPALPHSSPASTTITTLSTAPGAGVAPCCSRACPEPTKARGRFLLHVQRIQPWLHPPSIQGCLAGSVSKGMLYSSSCPISRALLLHTASDTSLHALLELK